jgi:hypothetical protein
MIFKIKPRDLKKNSHFGTGGKVKVTSLYMPQRASQQKLGKKPATCLNKSGSACMRLLFRALNLFLSWLVITVSLILRSMQS